MSDRLSAINIDRMYEVPMVSGKKKEQVLYKMAVAIDTDKSVVIIATKINDYCHRPVSFTATN